MARGMTLNVGGSIERGTRISDIHVPQEMRKRLKSGLTFLDNAIGEGWVPSAVMMLTGTPGAGKTTMLLQLANSITSAGHVCLYNTGEESLYQVKMVVERLGLRNDFYVNSDIMVQDLIDHAEQLRQTTGKQVFILQDSLQTLDDGKYTNGANSVTPLRCAEMLTEWAKKHFQNVVFIGQVNKDGSFNGKNAILHAIDIRGHLYVDDNKKSETFGERIFEITKNRFGSNGTSYILGLNSGGLYERGTLSWT
jgi:DNA repair protein RadA/Sms